MKTWSIKLPASHEELPKGVQEAIRLAFRSMKKCDLWHEVRLLEDNVMYAVQFRQHEYVNSKREYWQAHVTATPLFSGQTQFEVPMKGK